MLEVYFKDDIAHGLTGLTVGMLRTAQAHGQTNVEYVRGALDLASALAMNYGIPWAVLQRDVIAALSGDVVALIGECGKE